MKEFRTFNRLSDDECFYTVRENENNSIEKYNMENFYYTNDCDCKIINDFAAENNMTIKDGFGFTNRCVIDNDSKLRINNEGVSHNKGKIQLCTRWDKGVPNVNKGGLIPNIESKLKSKMDTSFIRNCDHLSERDFDRNIPLVGCLKNFVQNEKYIVEPWIRGGAMTRNDTRSSSSKYSKC